MIFINYIEFLFIFRGVRHKEGFRALFKGLGPNLVGVIPSRYLS